jgi:hypothetical protein
MVSATKGGWLSRMATQLLQVLYRDCGKRSIKGRPKSLCESEVEAPWIAGTDLWAS